MRLYGICVVRNESDVLEEVITAAAGWADRIFISDNESGDGTPAIIRSLAARHANVFDAGAIAGPFSDDLRGVVFNRVRKVSRPGDWWCKLDADEIFIDDPREFLARVPPETDTVWGSFFTFYFTDEDLLAYERDPAEFLARPVVERLKHYRNNESEIRFVKHTRPFIWHREWPRFRCAAHTRRIRVAHYRYRSPEQISRRLQLRRQVAGRTRGSLFPHELGRLPAGVPADAESAGSAVPSDETSTFMQRVVGVRGLDSTADGPWIEREKELRPITDVRPAGVPFAIWKPFCIVRALLDIRRYLPSRLRRLLPGRR